MKIGLMGFEFESPNKGCEALCYSFISMLNKIVIENENVVIYNFTSCSLGMIPELYIRFKFVRVAPVLKDIKLTYIKALKDCDFIFDVTMGDSFADIYSKNYCRYLMKEKKLAEFFCKNYISLPQTYGPFYDNRNKKMAERILRNAKQVYCRDELSKKMIEKKFSINDSILTSDMAFMLPYESDMFNIEASETIGINVSGLLYRGGFNSDNQFNLTINYKEYINKLIEYLIATNSTIHLIPHVIDTNENAHDDDYMISKMLANKYPTVILAPKFRNAIEAKSYISKMDLFIGSRMHSTVAAFSSGVVTIPVSYSRKFEGLFNNIKYEYVINGRTETTETAINITKEYILKKDNLLLRQQESLKIIEEVIKEFETSIYNVLYGSLESEIV